MSDAQRCIRARNALWAALEGPGSVLGDLEEAVELACQRIAAGARGPAAAVPALKRFAEVWQPEDGNDPLERLRFFCSLAMNGQDSLDVEQFFDALSATLREPQPLRITGRIAWPPLTGLPGAP